MIGIDMVEIARITALKERFGDRALRRFMSDEEIGVFGAKIESVAGLWAAKEAVSKALGAGIGAKLNFHDITIIKSEEGAPIAVLSPRAAKRFGIDRLSTSITHEKGYAIAVALALALAASPPAN
ncbi:MAG: holo-ACP synthase [Helicobacteraceae bacterium]|jgi:holo-[acyl-carrier protein] synthase|nr:holo-ACP synthase [Helicobacteraceae bacterium]